jgi:hypothetical protein
MAKKAEFNQNRESLILPDSVFPTGIKIIGNNFIGNHPKVSTHFLQSLASIFLVGSVVL